MLSVNLITVSFSILLVLFKAAKLSLGHGAGLLEGNCKASLCSIVLRYMFLCTTIFTITM